MKRWLRVALAVWFVGSAPAQNQGSAEQPAIFAEVDSIVRQLAEITGFELKRPVEKDVIDRKNLKRFLEERVAEEIKPEEIRVESLLLKKFGFVPEDFDLKGTMIELYTEQAAAFYDFHKGRLFLLDSNDDMTQETALIHELAHALADQHFPLEEYLDAAGKNDDGAMARLAVMEGQATWLMSEFMVRRMGRTLVDSPDMVDLMSRMIGGSAGEFPVFESAPLYIRESLIFPYTSGMKFQQKVVERKGKDGFALVFRDPPETTREVLHPEVYFEETEMTAPGLPELRKRKRYDRLATGTVGEFDFAVLLRQYGSDDAARAIAPGWRTGKYAFLEHKKDKDTVLLHSSVWAGADIAGKFAAEYRKALEGKWERMEVLREGNGEVLGTGDDGHFIIRVAGAAVYVAEGLRDAGQIRSWPQP